MTVAHLHACEDHDDRHDARPVPRLVGPPTRPSDTDRQVAALRRRSAWLTSQAPEVHPLLAAAYRRRAAEIRLGAWALAMRSGAVLVPSPDAA